MRQAIAFGLTFTVTYFPLYLGYFFAKWNRILRTVVVHYWKLLCILRKFSLQRGLGSWSIVSWPIVLRCDWTSIVLFFWILPTLFFWVVFSLCIFCNVLFVGISQVIGCDDRLLNVLECVRCGVCSWFCNGNVNFNFQMLTTACHKPCG